MRSASRSTRTFFHPCGLAERLASAAAIGLGLLAFVPASADAQFYTDTGTPSNPPWSEIFPTLNDDAPDPGPVPGSVINVNNAATEVGLYGNRPISVGTQRIHVCCNTSTTDLDGFTRWFQTDGNTQVFRLFVNDENTASSRVGAARCEAFMEAGWDYSDNVTYEWTGRYTIARRQQNYAIFQLFNLDNEWALQLNITISGGLLVNNRRNASDLLITNPDGSTKDFDGKGFDVRVIDDGLNYKCWIDGVLVADNFYDRPTNISRFRWGKYLGDNILTPPSTNSVILVSGAQVRSWPGRLDAATTDIVKANNTTNLGSTGSWTGGKTPGINNRAVWNNTVTSANSATLNTDMTWAGIRILDPGGNVTINGTATLKLEDAGLDMSAATRNLTVNCPVELNVAAPWVIAASRAAAFNDPIRGYQGITLTGGGKLIMDAPNTYTGPTTISGGILQLGDGGTTGALDTGSAISVASGASFAVNRSDAVSQGTHFSGSPITGAGGLEKSGTGTLTLIAANTYTGSTTINVGTLQLGSGGTTGSLGTSSAISVASGASFAVNRSDAVSQGTHFSGAAITGGGGLIKSGAGMLTLTAANTYSGPTTINAGTLAFSNVSPFNNTPVINLSGGALLLPTIGGATINSPVAVGTGGTTAWISAPTNLPGAGVVSALSLAREITGDGDVAFTSGADQNALSTILLNANSSYNGGTLLDTGGTEATQIIVKLGIANALPTSTVLEIDGQIGEGSGRFAELNLNGFSQQLAGLTNTPRNLRIQRIVNSNISAAATLTINNTANHAFSGSLGGSANGSVSASAMPGSTNGNNFALAKGGAGTLTLNGSNSYSGNTTVNRGTLVLGSANPNNESSTITIAATGATLNLAFSGTDTVRELFIGSTLMAPGVYEAVGNPGPGIEIPQITGAGTLTVTTGSAPVVGYAAWKTANGTSQPIEGDHDGDGVPNGVELFLGGNGNTTGFTALPSVVNSAGSLNITWTKGGNYSGSYGTHFTVETSDSLTGNWTTEIASPGANATVTFPTASTVRYTFPPPVSGRRFARLKVSGP